MVRLSGGNPFNGILQCGGKGGTGSIPAAILTQFPGATVGANSNPGCLNGHLFNPAPRIGFAYDPTGEGKMVIRGGYGVFFEHTNGNEGNSESLEGSAPLVLSSQQFNVSDSRTSGGGGGGVLFPLILHSNPKQSRSGLTFNSGTSTCRRNCPVISLRRCPTSAARARI